MCVCVCACGVWGPLLLLLHWIACVISNGRCPMGRGPTAGDNCWSHLLGHRVQEEASAHHCSWRLSLTQELFATDFFLLTPLQSEMGPSVQSEMMPSLPGLQPAAWAFPLRCLLLYGFSQALHLKSNRDNLTVSPSCARQGVALVGL